MYLKTYNKQWLFDRLRLGHGEHLHTAMMLACRVLTLAIVGTRVHLYQSRASFAVTVFETDGKSLQFLCL